MWPPSWWSHRAAVRFPGGPVDDPDRFRDWTTAAWAEVAATMLARRTPAPEGPAPFLLALDGRPLAWTAPHGQALHWVSPTHHSGRPTRNTP